MVLYSKYAYVLRLVYDGSGRKVIKAQVTVEIRIWILFCKVLIFFSVMKSSML